MPKPISDILGQLFSQSNSWHIQLLQAWPTIVGTIKTTVHLLKIGEDCLTIGVADSCWLQELYMLSPLLVSLINQKLDQPRIKKLRFRIVATPSVKKKERSLQTPAKSIRPHLSITEQKALAAIADEQLRTALKNYLIRCYQQR